MNRTLFTLVMPLLFLTGCGESEQTALQKKLLLKSAPENISVFSKVRSTLQEVDGPKEIEVAVRGRIYAGADNEPWEPGKAAFFLTDFAGHDGKTEHDPYGCPYCSEKIEDYRAYVSFSDSNGIINIDSRELFGVKEKQSVIVKGTATLDPSGEELMISGTGIFIPKE